MTQREPTLKPISIADLRPTQMTVGQREVEQKRRQWRELAETKGPEFLGRHMVPTVLGPKGRHYVLDHHHLVRALHEEGVKEVLATVEADLSALKKTSFWVYLAGELRRAGGFAKDTTPFSEFLWADFLRSRIKPKALDKHFESALDKALVLAKTKDAAYLPGWCGPNPIG
jgi:hypothetical protein